MKKNILLFTIFSLLFFAISCSKKTTETGTKITTPTNEPTNKVADKKEVRYKPIVKTPTPKSITVNEKAATKTVDGRYYYDLEGKRYWRNNKDGKFYLYYKDMFENKDFQ